MVSNNYCIFYAEDDPEDQQLFRDVVSEINSELDLHIQNDGQELIDQLHNPPPRPRLVFLDLNMPRKNGLQALKEIRQSEHLKNLPVIIFTTSDDSHSVEITKDLGASIYITKPSFFSSFKKAISHCLTTDWSKFNPAQEKFVLSFS